MRFTFTQKTPKVSAACSKDLVRPALTAAWLDTAAGELRATDSYIALRMPVTVDPDDTDGWIGADALDRAVKRDGGGVSANGACIVWDAEPGDYDAPAATVAARTVATFPRCDYGQAVNLPQLWPGDRDGFTVGLNAGFLKRLADAMGAGDAGVRLTFQRCDDGTPDPLRPIIVRPMSAPDERSDGLEGVPAPEGLLMPVRL